MKLAIVIGALVIGAILATGAVAWTLGMGQSEQSDRVVGVLLKCESLPSVSLLGTPNPGGAPLNGEACQTKNSTGYASRNRRLEVTVRTASGQTYLVEVAPNIRVAIGQNWP